MINSARPKKKPMRIQGNFIQNAFDNCTLKVKHILGRAVDVF